MTDVSKMRRSGFLGFSIGDRKVVEVKEGNEIVIAKDATFDDLRSTIIYMVTVIDRLSKPDERLK